MPPVAAKGQFGPYAEPAVVLVYGTSATGKTADAMRAFAGRILCLGLPGSFKAHHRLLGVTAPPKVDCSTIEQATSFILQAGKMKRFLAILVDDISVMAMNSWNAICERVPPNKVFQRWDEIKKLLADFCMAARYAGVYLIATGHKAEAGTDSQGRWSLGGPAMPAKTIQATTAHLFDFALRTMTLPETPFMWKAGYHCRNNDPSWAEKDRHHCLPRPMVPQNIGEILRLAGYPIPRAVGVEWHDDLIDPLAQKLAALSPGDVNAFTECAMPLVNALLAKGKPRPHVEWLLYDAWCRGELRYRDPQVTAEDLVRALVGDGSGGGEIGGL